MGLTLGPTGLLMLHNGELFTDENGYDCCCEDLGCTGCNKWVSDLSGQSISTVTIDGCGFTESWSGLEETGGNTNCGGNQTIHFPQGSVFTEGDFILSWNDTTGKFVGSLLTSFQSADCGLGTITEIDYECTECYFRIVLSVAVLDVSGCFCAGPVIFTLEMDLSTGPDCIS